MKKNNQELIPLSELYQDDKEKKYNDEYYIMRLNKNRYILLYNEICEEVAENIVSKIYIMNQESNEEIILEINSGGGDVSSGLAIINAIKSSIAPITTIINGQAASMAAMISIFGHKRLMYKNSYYMQHPTAAMVSDDVSKIQDRTQYLMKAELEMEKMIKSKTKLSGKDILKIRHGELWLNAKEAKEKGVIDQII